MFTVCPKCALTLVVTAADLRIAQGYVRCGRCLNVFNALARLSEERPGAAPAPASAATQTPTPTSPPESAASDTEVPAQTMQPSTPASTLDDTGEIEIELDASAFVTSRGPPATQEGTTERTPLRPASTPPEQADPVPQPAPEAPVEAEPALPPTAADDADVMPDAVSIDHGTEPPEPPPEPVSSEPHVEPSAPARLPETQQTNTPPPAPESTFDPVVRRPRAGLAWHLAAGVLTLALALQIVNHYRDALAAHAALRPLLSDVYARLGVKLAPRWNVHAYDVRQLGASTASTAAGEIVVRASVENSANRAQPLPLLRVTLQDRFGNRIAARDVSPKDYLPTAAAPRALLAAGSRVDATMVFVDPGPQAVGFEIDACLPGHDGAVDCAHGP